MKRKILWLSVLSVLCVLCLALVVACAPQEEGIAATGVSISGTGVNNGKLSVLSDNRDLQLTANVRPSDASNKTVVWTSSNAAVVTVSEGGLLHFVGEGTATVTATCGSVSDTLEVTVSSRVAVSSVSFKEESYAVTVLTSTGGSKDFSPEITVAPENATVRTVTWSIAPQDNYVSISAQGLVVVSALTPATNVYTVTATSVSDPTVSGSAQMTIAQPEATDIVVRLSSHGAAKKDGYVYEFYEDDSQFDSLCFVAEPRPVGSVFNCTFESSAPDICDVEKRDNVGILKIKAAGDAVITVKSGEVEKTVKVKINPPAGYIVDGLNLLESELQTDVDTTNYWNFNDNPQVKPGSVFYSKQEYDSISGIGLLGTEVDGTSWSCKQNPNQGNGAYVEDGGWCVVFTTWDWPFDNDQTNAYLFNKIHTPDGATTVRLQLRTQAEAYTSGKAKFRVRLVDVNDYGKYVFLDANGQTEEWFTKNMDENRPLEDKVTYPGTEFDPETGWLIIPGVPDYNIGEDYYFLTIPEAWRNKDVIMIIENDEMFEDDGYGNMVVGKCDKLLICSITFVDGDNDHTKYYTEE